MSSDGNGTDLHDGLLRARFFAGVLLHARCCRCGGDHERKRHFAAVLVGDTDDTDISDIRVVEEVPLELSGRDCEEGL